MQADALIDLALAEDIALGDVTSEAVFPPGHSSRAWICAKEPLVLCGAGIAAAVFRRVDPALDIRITAADGTALRAGGRVMALGGSTLSILKAERTALNFLQRLSGIATLSRRYAKRARELGVRVVDTRKTTPGWRALEKYAVRTGGCANHRASLADCVLIKDNHIAAAGSICGAVRLARERAPHVSKIEVEADTLEQVRECLAAKAEVILLDNMTPAQVAEARRLVGRRAILEVSGGVTLARLGAYARAGADVISVGALTHSAAAVDLSLEIEPAAG